MIVFCWQEPSHFAVRLDGIQILKHNNNFRLIEPIHYFHRAFTRWDLNTWEAWYFSTDNSRRTLPLDYIDGIQILKHNGIFWLLEHFCVCLRTFSVTYLFFLKRARDQPYQIATTLFLDFPDFLGFFLATRLLDR